MVDAIGVSTNFQSQTATILFGSSFSLGQAEVKITFSGVLNDNLAGENKFCCCFFKFELETILESPSAEVA